MRSLLLLLGVAVLFAGLFAAPWRDVFLYNGSASVPAGFYRRLAQAPAPGALVTVRARDVAPVYARLRGFDRAGDRFLKRIAATGGESVCAMGATVRVGDRLLKRQTRDLAGRKLPHWTGCRRLRADEAFLLGDTPDSFDSRYWGPVELAHIEGVWTPL